MVQTNTQRAAEIDFPKYGHIYLVDLEPVVGSEIGKRRPVLVISNDRNNQYSDTVTVLPITGQPETRNYPFEVTLPKGVGGLKLDSRVKCNHVRTVDKRRLVAFIGVLPSKYLPQVETAIKIHFNMK